MVCDYYKTKSTPKISIKRKAIAKGGHAPYGHGYLEGKLAPVPKEYKFVLDINLQEKYGSTKSLIELSIDTNEISKSLCLNGN